MATLVYMDCWPRLELLVLASLPSSNTGNAQVLQGYDGCGSGSQRRCFKSGDSRPKRQWQCVLFETIFIHCTVDRSKIQYWETSRRRWSGLVLNRSDPHGCWLWLFVYHILFLYVRRGCTIIYMYVYVWYPLATGGHRFLATSNQISKFAASA